MAIATRERTTTNPGVKPELVEIPQEAQAQPGPREPRPNVPATTRAVMIADVGSTRKGGLIRRSARALGEVSFQLGISYPGRLWYRESRQLSAKEKSESDARMMGFF